MKITLRLFFIFALLFHFSCETEDDSEDNVVIPPPPVPELTFYIEQDLGVGNITVRIDNTLAGEITSYFPNGLSFGGGDASKVVSPGVHNWTAVADDNTQWSGSVNTIDCTKIKLTSSNTGSGNGGSGNGGNNCNNEIQIVSASNIIYGNACGNPSSARLYYRNNTNTSQRVRFMLINQAGNWTGQNLGFIADPGETKQQHFCTPKYVNNQICYAILVKDVNSSCDFPDTLTRCNGF